MTRSRQARRRIRRSRPQAAEEHGAPVHVLRCRSRGTRRSHARRAPLEQAVGRRSALRQYERRSGAALLQRRHHRRHHHRAVALPADECGRAQFLLSLSRPRSRHDAGRPRARRALSGRRQRAPDRQAPPHHRAADRREDRPPLWAERFDRDRTTFSPFRTSLSAPSSRPSPAASRRPAPRSPGASRRPASPPMNACCAPTPCPSATPPRRPRRGRSTNRRSSSTPAMPAPMRCLRSTSPANGNATSTRRTACWTAPSSSPGRRWRSTRMTACATARSALSISTADRTTSRSTTIKALELNSNSASLIASSASSTAISAGPRRARLSQGSAHDRSVLRAVLVLDDAGRGAFHFPPVRRSDRGPQPRLRSLALVACAARRRPRPPRRRRGGAAPRGRGAAAGAELLDRQEPDARAAEAGGGSGASGGGDAAGGVAGVRVACLPAPSAHEGSHCPHSGRPAFSKPSRMCSASAGYL